MIFAIALTARLLHVWSMRSSPFFDVLLGDAQGYDMWAQQIAAGDWMGQGVFYQAPLYAYFLAALYTINHSLLLVRVCQAVIGASACVLLARAARHVFGTTAGLLAGLMLALYAPAIFFDGLVQKSVLDVFFLCLLLSLLTASRTCWFAAGLVLGALSLTRENALLFVPVVVGWMWWGPRITPAVRTRQIAILLAGVSVVLLPTGLRNWKAGGEFHLTTAQSGPNLFIGNSAHADGTYVPLRFGRGSPEYERADATEIAERALGRTLSAGEVSSYWTRRALQYIREQPADWLALEARKLRLLLNVTEVVDTESQESHEDYSWLLRLLGYVAHFGVLAPFACCGVWLTWSDRRRLWLLYGMILVYALSVLAFYVVARYRLPLVPLLIVFAAAAIGHGRAAITTLTPTPATIACGIGIAAAAVFCNVPAVPADAMRVVTYHNLGTALQASGRFEDAAAAFGRALMLDPDYAPAHNGLGSVRRQEGRYDEAAGHFSTALRLAPGFDAARFNLANALRESGRPAEAIARYEELLSRVPDDAETHANLGVALAEAGRLDEAVGHFRRVVALTPRATKAHYNLGHSLLTQGDLGGAVEELALAVQLDPLDIASREELGSAYLALRQFVLAIEQFREAVRLAPRSASGHNDLGIALGSAGRYHEAIEEFRTALGLDPSFHQAGANLKAAVAVQQKLSHPP